MATKRKAAAMAVAEPEDPVDPADQLMFLALGGGNEVGRSCHIIQYKGKTVMVRILWPQTPRLAIISNVYLSPARRRTTSRPQRSSRSSILRRLRSQHHRRAPRQPVSDPLPRFVYSWAQGKAAAGRERPRGVSIGGPLPHCYIVLLWTREDDRLTRSLYISRWSRPRAATHLVLPAPLK